MAVSRTVKVQILLLVATLLVVAARFACADALSTITVRVGKRVLHLDPPAVRAIDEVYAPLQVLDALAIKYRVTPHAESVVLVTPDGADREIGLARPGPQPMLPLSGLAATLGYTMRLSDRHCDLLKPGEAAAPNRASNTDGPTAPTAKKADAAPPDKPVVRTKDKPHAESPAKVQVPEPLSQPETQAPPRTKPEPAPDQPARSQSGIQRAESLDDTGARPAEGPGPSRGVLPITRAPQQPLPGVDRDLLCPVSEPAHLQLVDFAAPDLAHAQLRLYFDRQVAPEVTYLANPSRLEIYVPNARPDALPECRVEHPFTRGVTLAPGRDPGSLRVTVFLGRLVAYSLTDTGPGVYALSLRLPKGAGVRPDDAVVVIDPGHGGNQTGCQLKAGDFCIEEKSLTLSIAKHVQAELKALGITHTYLTRTDDRVVDLYERPKIAAAHNADLFVSVHIDEWAKSTAACGPTAYYHRADESSRALAQSLIGHVARSSVSPSRGALSDGVLYASGLAVLRSATMPASLVECGFLTNPNDRKALVSDEYQVKIAKAIAQGIRGYLSASLPDQPAATLSTE